MNITTLYLLIMASASAVSPVSDFINEINAKATTWRANEHFNPRMQYLPGMLPNFSFHNAPIHHHQETDVVIPETFDARKEWPECAEIIGDIRDQASCGSCWAVAAVEAMSDRICIHSKGVDKVSVSAADLLTCCTGCGFGCGGGDLEPGWLYWGTHGIATGGAYNTSKGCKAYPFPPCEHYMEGDRPVCEKNQPTPDCKRTCDDPNVNYGRSLTFGSGYVIANSESQIQLEIMKNGPVQSGFSMYADFNAYKSGIYQHVSGLLVGGHGVKILGWGVEEGTKYWLIANSYNSDWGDNGYFKMLRGENHCGIEEHVNAGIPKPLSH